MNTITQLQREILAACLHDLENKFLKTSLNENDFDKLQHKKLFNWIKKQAEAEQAHDPMCAEYTELFPKDFLVTLDSTYVLPSAIHAALQQLRRLKKLERWKINLTNFQKTLLDNDPDQLLENIKKEYDEEIKNSIDNEYNIISIEELISLDIPPKKQILYPWLFEKDLVMVHGWRGIGKTQFSVGLATAIAGGGKFLKWQTTEKRKVLFIDGELPLETVQQRFIEANNISNGDCSGNVQILTPDIQKLNRPNIANIKSQERLNRTIENYDVIFLDNLSTLAGEIEENAASDWESIQTWMLNLRSQGKTIIFFHHTGKSGAQRGTSRREDVLDVVIGLEQPLQYDAEDGAKFIVSFKKSRNVSNEGLKEISEFEAWLKNDKWIIRDADYNADSEIIDMANEGLTPREINTEFRFMSIRKIKKILTEAKKEKLIDEKYRIL